ncbi:CLUMA_CG001591, isoform A [Clunio marinus]|uniref:CLUMA_CG001591, isoform A n=1 Tax=Clunio marinus TaxID=568069 RepID=A0A1J1HIB2_9DIPT|nr:CLUMA_CG001591, isoform A [Clunio marinus]
MKHHSASQTCNVLNQHLEELHNQHTVKYRKLKVNKKGRNKKEEEDTQKTESERSEPKGFEADMLYDFPRYVFMERCNDFAFVSRLIKDEICGRRNVTTE